MMDSCCESCTGPTSREDGFDTETVKGKRMTRAKASRLYSRRRFLRRQRLNAERYLAGLAKLDPGEFGPASTAPAPTHIGAANGLIVEARRVLKRDVSKLVRLERGLANDDGLMNAFLDLKEGIYRQTKEIEKLLAFYRGIFDQRRSRFGRQLLPIDRIARDCYQAVWLGLGEARSVPAPPPFAYIEDGNGPATYRRGVRLTALGKRPNPFPLVKIPQHRLHNPWTLGAVPHEVAHNLQNDLGMWPLLPKLIKQSMAGKIDPAAIEVWARWHKESFADLAGVLLIGPAYVESLIDVVGKTRERTASFSPRGVHPTPVVRVPLNCALLRRIGFEEEAEAFSAAWDQVYPKSLRRTLPPAFRDSFDEGARLMVDCICFMPTKAYGGKALADVVRFSRKDVAFVREAADRLVKGANTGVLPERYLIPAARLAIGARDADPVQIARHFYETLGRT